MPPQTPELLALGYAIRRLRQDRGLSQDRLALEAGIDRAYVGRVERGERNPTYLKLQQIASTLGLKTSELLSAAEVEAAPRRRRKGR